MSEVFAFESESRFVLESAWLRAEFSPDLGGRLARLFDPRLGLELLPDPGLAFTWDGSSLAEGPTPVRLEEEAAEVWSFFLVGKLGIHIRASLVPDRAALRLEARVTNRGLASIRVQPGFIWPKSAALAALSGSGFRFSAPEPLAGRVTETFAIELVPVGGIGEVRAVSQAAALGFSDDGIAVSAFREIPEAKLFVLTASGQTLEAPADLRPEIVQRFKFEELGGEPSGFAVRDANGAEVLRYPTPALEEINISWEASELDVSEATEKDLAAIEHRVEVRHLAAARRTQLAFARGDFANASLFAEQELLYNGDDALGWIEKAIAGRQAAADDPGEDGGELENAHFLAPLEPLLRAEAYLRSSVEAYGLLSELVAFPELGIEVVSFYLERGLNPDASRLLGGLWELAPSARVAYLRAHVALQAEFEADAAEWMVRASRLEFEAANVSEFESSIYPGLKARFLNLAARLPGG